MCSDCKGSGDDMMDDDEFLNAVGAAAENPPPPPGQEFDEHGRGYWNCPGMDAQIPGGSDSADAHLHEVRHPATKVDANLISSKCSDGRHRPVLDFDIPVRYLPSTTPGHGHLYIDKSMNWAAYAALIIAMRNAGLLESGYVNAALKRGATFVRPPWVKKPAAPESE